MSMEVSSIHFEGDEYFGPQALRFLVPLKVFPENQDFAWRIQRLTYLTAERIGPREVYSLEDPSSTQVVRGAGRTRSKRAALGT